MRARVTPLDAPPLAALVRFDPASWSREEWQQARREYAARCRSLADLNALYPVGADFGLPDPRRSP